MDTFPLICCAVCHSKMADNTCNKREFMATVYTKTTIFHFDQTRRITQLLRRTNTFLFLFRRCLYTTSILTRFPPPPRPSLRHSLLPLFSFILFYRHVLLPNVRYPPPQANKQMVITYIIYFSSWRREV